VVQLLTVTPTFFRDIFQQLLHSVAVILLVYIFVAVQKKYVFCEQLDAPFVPFKPLSEMSLEIQTRLVQSHQFDPVAQQFGRYQTQTRVGLAHDVIFDIFDVRKNVPGGFFRHIRVYQIEILGGRYSLRHEIFFRDVWPGGHQVRVSPEKLTHFGFLRLCRRSQLLDHGFRRLFWRRRSILATCAKLPRCATIYTETVRKRDAISTIKCPPLGIHRL
jgi:hypothetical protein